MKIIKDTSKMTHEEWLDYRRKGIGGSDVGAICGLSKYKTAYAVYLAKIDELPKDEESEPAYWGHQLEDVVAKEFEKRTGKTVREEKNFLRHPKYKFMLANLDRIVVGENAILECKTTSSYGSNDWAGDKIPESYILQCQHYLAVTGFDICYIACLIGGQKFVWKTIERNDELIETMIQIEKDFWENYVLAKIPPTIDGLSKTVETVNKMFPSSEPTQINLGPTALHIVKELEKLKKEQKILESKINLLENQLKVMLNVNETGNIGTYQVNWKNYSYKRVDTTLLKEKYPNIHQECLKEGNGRKFSIKNLEE